MKRKPRQLSGGQRQRVALGRAIVRHPRVFLFDEPLSNLDAKLRVQMRVELKKLHERLGTTAIYVTHDQVEAMTLGDRVVVMRDGRVQQVGDPLELYNEPANRFVAGFIGSPAMNFADRADRIRRRRAVWATGEGIRLKVPAGPGRAPGALCRQGGHLRHPARGSAHCRRGRPGRNDHRCRRSRSSSGSAPRSCSTCAVGPATMVASVEPTVTAKVHDQLRSRSTRDRVHFFDNTTEAAI